MIISKTPLRISFFGGGTDYPVYFHQAKGAVLGTTINKYIYVSVNRLSEFFDHRIRVGYSRAELVKHVDEIIHPSVRETLKFLNIDGNLDIHIFADLPAQTGLGSSSAFTVGLLSALHALEKKEVTKHQRALDAIHIEQNLIKEHVGSQDQMHAAHGGLNIIEFSKEGIEVRPVAITDAKMALLEKSMLIFYTGLTRFASEVLVEQIEKTKSGNSHEHLSSMYQMVFDAEKIIAHESPETMIRKLGTLLNEAWRLKKSLSTKISNDRIDEMYARAMAAGAYGGKLAGAGSGGFLFFLVPQEKQAAVRKALGEYLEVDFSLEKEGSRIIHIGE